MLNGSTQFFEAMKRDRDMYRTQFTDSQCNILNLPVYLYDLN